MKALVIAPQPFFTPRGTPFSVYYRTMIMSQLGVEIDLVTYGEGEDVNLPNVNIIRIPRFKIFGNVKLGPSFLKLFLDVFLFFKALRLLQKNKYDFLHAHEEAVFMSLIYKKLFNFKLIYDVHSSLPQQLSNFQFTESKTVLKIFEKLEISSFKNASAIITICPDLYDYVISKISDNEKLFLIENSIFDSVQLNNKDSGKEKDAEEVSRAVLEKVIGNKLVVYAGTLETYQGIDILVESFKMVVNEVPEAVLIVVGGTKDQVQKFKKLADENGLDDKIIFTGRVPQKAAKNLNSAADVLVSPRTAGTNTPLKIYEQISLGKPLVATKIYSHTQVLDDDVAFLVDPDPESLAKGIVASVKSNGAAHQKGEKARKLYEEKYSREAYTGKMKKLLEYLDKCAE